MALALLYDGKARRPKDMGKELGWDTKVASSAVYANYLAGWVDQLPDKQGYKINRKGMLKAEQDGLTSTPQPTVVGHIEEEPATSPNGFGNLFELVGVTKTLDQVVRSLDDKSLYTINPI